MNKKINWLNRNLNYKQQKLQTLLNRRLFLGFAIIFIFFLASLSQWNGIYVLLVVGLSVFFVFYYQLTKKYQHHLFFLNQLLLFYERTKARQRGTYKNKSYPLTNYPNHLQTMAQDLHLAGEMSVFNLMDETITQQGQETLLKTLIDPQMSKTEILNQQNLIRDLNKNWWSLVKLRLQKSQGKPANLQQTLKDVQRSIVGMHFHKILIIHISLFLLMWLAIGYTLLTGTKLNPIALFTIYLLFSLSTRSNVASAFRRAHDISQQVLQLSHIIQFIETHKNHPLFSKHFTSCLQLKLQRQLNKLQRYMTFLSVEGHPMVHLVLNSICPWDYIITFFVERWRQQVADKLPKVLSELAQFEVLM
ncbi:MAG: hypothetical protein KDD40_12465, partial [Bdellovibrionales bacterium]|nr:hypothetical protein [Bdellovibrionales bacterium]